MYNQQLYNHNLVQSEVAQPELCIIKSCVIARKRREEDGRPVIADQRTQVADRLISCHWENQNVVFLLEAIILMILAQLYATSPLEISGGLPSNPLRLYPTKYIKSDPLTGLNANANANVIDAKARWRLPTTRCESIRI